MNDDERDALIHSGEKFAAIWTNLEAWLGFGSFGTFCTFIYPFRLVFLA